MDTLSPLHFLQQKCMSAICASLHDNWLICSSPQGQNNCASWQTRVEECWGCAPMHTCAHQCLLLCTNACSDVCAGVPWCTMVHMCAQSTPVLFTQSSCKNRWTKAHLHGVGVWDTPVSHWNGLLAMIGHLLATHRPWLVMTKSQ